MCIRVSSLLAVAALCAAAPAIAQSRDYCPARPGIGDQPCTIEPRRWSLELGLAAWERNTGADAHSDTLVFGDMVVRTGLTATTELGVAWSSHIRTRARDFATGAVSIAHGSGDVTLMLKQNLTHPGGEGFTVSVAPYASLPVGGDAVSAGDWAAGLVLPFAYDLGHGVALTGTSEVAAATDADQRGRHLFVSQILGLEVAVGRQLNVTGEIQALRDRDPDEATTQAYAALSLDWAPSEAWQWDVGAVAGLNDHASNLQIYLGVSRRF